MWSIRALAPPCAFTLAFHYLHITACGDVQHLLSVSPLWLPFSFSFSSRHILTLLSASTCLAYFRSLFIALSLKTLPLARQQKLINKVFNCKRWTFRGRLLECERTIICSQSLCRGIWWLVCLVCLPASWLSFRVISNISYACPFVARTSLVIKSFLVWEADLSTLWIFFHPRTLGLQQSFTRPSILYRTLFYSLAPSSVTSLYSVLAGV